MMVVSSANFTEQFVYRGALSTEPDGGGCVLK